MLWTRAMNVLSTKCEFHLKASGQVHAFETFCEISGIDGSAKEP